MTSLSHNKMGEHIIYSLLGISPYHLKSVLRLFLLGFPDSLMSLHEMIKKFPLSYGKMFRQLLWFLTTHFSTLLFEAMSQWLFKSYDLPHFNLLYNTCQGFLFFIYTMHMVKYFYGRSTAEHCHSILSPGLFDNYAENGRLKNSITLGSVT